MIKILKSFTKLEYAIKAEGNTFLYENGFTNQHLNRTGLKKLNNLLSMVKYVPNKFLLTIVAAGMLRVTVLNYNRS